MIKFESNKNCCGCTSCSSICPREAITMVPDKEGFLYPQVDYAKCVECGLCEVACPYINRIRPENDLEQVYAARTMDEAMRDKSSSGGMFAEIAQFILKNDGIVFGAAYNEYWLVHHKGVSELSDLDDLIGSKYMQSDLNGVFPKIKSYLENQKKVLFVGTTCQVNGLKNYLKKDYENLYTVDFICLGVPSPLIWRDYLDTFFYDEKISKINFKDKSLGWRTFSLRIKGDGMDFCRNGRETYYFNGYFKHLYTRPSCSNCVYKTGNRMSDITISDCWGAEYIAPEIDDNKGLSSVICHSQKGAELFESCKGQLVWKNAKLEDVEKYNNGYRTCVDESPLKKKFWRDYYSLDKERLFKKYCRPERTDICYRMLRKIRKMICRSK